MFSPRDLRFFCSLDRKGSWAFYLNYPQINEVVKSDHIFSEVPMIPAVPATRDWDRATLVPSSFPRFSHKERSRYGPRHFAAILPGMLRRDWSTQLLLWSRQWVPPFHFISFLSEDFNCLSYSSESWLYCQSCSFSWCGWIDRIGSSKRLPSFQFLLIHYFNNRRHFDFLCILMGVIKHVWQSQWKSSMNILSLCF